MYRREKLDGKILLATHHRRFLITLVLISAQMEQPMGEDTQKFLLKRDRKQFRIFSNSLNTNEYIPIQKISLNIIKGDDVRQRVVIQIRQIDLQKIIVITKNIVDLSYLETLMGSQRRKPALVQEFLGKLKIRLGMKKNHCIKFEAQN